MSDDLIDRLQNPHFDDLQWPKGLFAEAADRIETLEAALREIDKRLNNPDSWLAQSIDARNIISAVLEEPK